MQQLLTKDDSSTDSSEKVYADNYYNRKHNRVGKPLDSVSVPAILQVNIDMPLSRSLGRVGKPRGTCPNKKCPNADLLQKLKYMIEGEDFPDVIPFEELELLSQIGSGGFGVVHMADWIDDIVAVKKLWVKRVSQRRRQQFEDEIKLFCTLQHPNIVGFLGACVVSPNLAIVMEYMDMSLYEALHMKQVEFDDKEKLSIMRDVAQGIDYLHEKSIAHCDLKTQNVLLKNVPGQEITDSQEMVIAKLTDFGQSMMKNEVESSASAGTAVSNIETPRYSAPEVLRGELLNVEQLMKADVYSEGLLILELVVEEIAFEDLTIQQLRVQVGEKNLKPDIPRDLILDKQLKEMLEKCWSSKPDDRPSSHSVCLTVDKIHNLFIKK